MPSQRPKHEMAHEVGQVYWVAVITLLATVALSMICFRSPNIVSTSLLRVALCTDPCKSEAASIRHQIGEDRVTHTSQRGHKHQWQHDGLGLEHCQEHAAAPTRILVTGAAGFIGYHVSQALAQQPGTLVVGMDNFNRYYNVTIKRERQRLLLKCCNITVVEGDIRDYQLLQQLLHCCRFTQVVHLAAQAGVRASVEHPTDYILNNEVGTVTLLEAITQQHPTPTLVYASTSSVYGTTGYTLQPSSEEGNHIRKLTSVYAATKLATEHLVDVYVHQNNIAATGLRFFTVYGPLGRPDMAVFRFAQALTGNKTILLTCFPNDQASGAASMMSAGGSISNNGKHPATSVESFAPTVSDARTAGSMSSSNPAHCRLPFRDFTYIDDITDGVLRACNFTTQPGKHGHNIYNLGRGQPARIAELLHHLEDALGTKATNVELKVASAASADVFVTWANTSAAKRDLGFTAQVGLREGIQKFAKWYLAEYGSHRIEYA